MKRWSKLAASAAAALMTAILLAIPVFADGSIDMEPRKYPGWNGAGPQITGPMPGVWCEDDWDDEDDGEGGPGLAFTQGWRYSPSGWWYMDSQGSWPSDRWMMIDYRWYRFNQSGHLATGWFTDGDGNRYYLNPVDDGTYGSMRTGWQIIDGKAYYFNPKADGSQGRLLTDTVTPDGYHVGADGALIG